MATYDKAHHIVSLTDDEARSGVTGHNVRYVLAFGMTGVIAAFVGIAIYFGFDALQDRLSTAFAQSPFVMLHALAAYAMFALIGAIIAGLVLGIWNMVSGRSESGSQTFMRLRVAAQFALICVIMVMLGHAFG